MTAPTMKTYTQRRPAFAEPSTTDTPLPTVGPDHTQTANDPTPVADTPKKPRFRVGNTSLGKNKKVRSDVRKLTENDEKVLCGWYTRIGKMLTHIRPELGTEIVNQADDCARSWCELADKNDKVRHMILAVIEGGEWGKVIGAHAPIVLAALPEKAVERFMLKGMGMFATFMSNDENDTTVDDEIAAGRMI